MAIQDVNVHPLGAGLLRFGDLFAQPTEVGSQDRRSNLDHLWPPHQFLARGLK
jgi:hypothetical protein